MIRINELNKKFGSNIILNNISFELKKGEVLVIIGPSGSGKTTLLRSINFLESADKGTISIGDVSVDCEKKDKKAIKALRAKTAMVFQSYNLFHNLTALQNITEALRYAKNQSKKDAVEKGLKLLDKVGLADKKDFYPSQLSGGQKQRIGIARAMAVNPELLLLDEPTSALDPELVGEVIDTINELASEGQTMIVVTHDMKLAKKIATKIIFMEEGNIIEEGDAETIFNSPETDRLKNFVINLNGGDI